MLRMRLYVVIDISYGGNFSRSLRIPLWELQRNKWEFIKYSAMRFLGPPCALELWREVGRPNLLLGIEGGSHALGCASWGERELAYWNCYWSRNLGIGILSVWIVNKRYIPSCGLIWRYESTRM
jgi:hypothetical protein